MVENVSGERGAYSTEAVACGLDDVAGWLENEGWIPKHVRQIRLGSKRLRELAPAMSPREGGDAVAAPGRSSASAVDGEAGQAPEATHSKTELVHPDLSRISEENAALRAERDRLLNQAKRHEALIAFVLKWCDRGPPHGGPGNEAVALDAIRHHPVIRAARQALTLSEEPPHGR